jgi:EAL domain-containing protein (putative c-di-GMP-specific phosphodiesterase class I)
VLHYQPICDATSEEIRSVEALVRWRHPHRGLVQPDVFIPLAEQTGLIVPIGAWVLRQACEHVNPLRAGDRPIDLSVNVSVQQLATPGFIETVQRALRETRLDPNRLILEVTESMLGGSDAAITTQFRELRELGVRLSVDDFGTGHSSLGRLRRLPVNCLKIDKSFIDEINDAGSDDAIIRAVVAMGHGLGLHVVAEGVETAAQLQRLRELRCDSVQGFLLDRPMPIEQLRRQLTGIPGRPVA